MRELLHARDPTHPLEPTTAIATTAATRTTHAALALALTAGGLGRLLLRREVLSGPVDRHELIDDLLLERIEVLHRHRPAALALVVVVVVVLPPALRKRWGRGNRRGHALALVRVRRRARRRAHRRLCRGAAATALPVGEATPPAQLVAPLPDVAERGAHLCLRLVERPQLRLVREHAHALALRRDLRAQLRVRVVAHAGVATHRAQHLGLVQHRLPGLRAAAVGRPRGAREQLPRALGERQRVHPLRIVVVIVVVVIVVIVVVVVVVVVVGAFARWAVVEAEAQVAVVQRLAVVADGALEPQPLDAPLATALDRRQPQRRVADDVVVVGEVLVPQYDAQPRRPRRPLVHLQLQPVAPLWVLVVAHHRRLDELRLAIDHHRHLPAATTITTITRTAAADRAIGPASATPDGSGTAGRAAVGTTAAALRSARGFEQRECDVRVGRAAPLAEVGVGDVGGADALQVQRRRRLEQVVDEQQRRVARVALGLDADDRDARRGDAERARQVVLEEAREARVPRVVARHLLEGEPQPHRLPHPPHRQRAPLLELSLLLLLPRRVVGAILRGLHEGPLELRQHPPRRRELLGR